MGTILTPFLLMAAGITNTRRVVFIKAGLIVEDYLGGSIDLVWYTDLKAARIVIGTMFESELSKLPIFVW